MMGIKEHINMDSEIQTHEKKKYIVVKNHVREIPSFKEDETNNENTKEVEKKDKKKKRKRSLSRSSSSESENSVSEISENDLNELRNAYNKCKSIIEKIESKYGHLLQSDEQSCSRIGKHGHSFTECHCGFKRKIVYDDDGKQVYQNVDAEHHICPTKVLKRNKQDEHSLEPMNVTLEDETSYNLPDTIKELGEMLQEQKLSKYMRYNIMQKMKSIRLEHINTLRYEKPKLIGKLKTNSSEIFEFEGSNLPSLPGYPVDKVS